MKTKPERPDFDFLRERAENGWGAHPSHVLWMLDMLKEAAETMQYLADEHIMMNADEWIRRYKGEDYD